MAPDYVWIDGWRSIGDELDRVIAAVADRGQPVVVYVPTGDGRDRLPDAVPDRLAGALGRLFEREDAAIERHRRTLTDRLDDLDIRYEVVHPSGTDTTGAHGLFAGPLLVLALPVALLADRVESVLFRLHRRSGSALPLRAATLLRRPLFETDPAEFTALGRAIAETRAATGREPLVVAATPEVVRHPDPDTDRR